MNITLQHFTGKNLQLTYRNTIKEQLESLGDKSNNEIKAAVYAKEIESLKKKSTPI